MNTCNCLLVTKRAYKWNWYINDVVIDSKTELIVGIAEMRCRKINSLGIEYIGVAQNEREKFEMVWSCYEEM